MRILLTVLFALCVASVIGKTTYKDLLNYVDNCNAQYLQLCSTSFNDIRKVHPLRSLACLYANNKNLSGPCVIDVYNHPFGACAKEAIAISGSCKVNFADPGDKGMDDTNWITDFYPFRTAVECLTSKIEQVNDPICAGKVKSSGFFVCQSDIKTFCSSPQITNAAQLMSCLSYHRSNIEGVECSKAMDQAIPQNWDNFNADQVEYYSRIFYGVPYGSLKDVGLVDKIQSRKLTPLGIFFVFACLASAIGAAIYAKKK